MKKNIDYINVTKGQNIANEVNNILSSGDIDKKRLLLEDFLQNKRFANQLVNDIVDDEKIEKYCRSFVNKDKYEKAELFNKILKQRVASKKRILFKKVIGVAAALIAISFAVYFYIENDVHNEIALVIEPNNKKSGIEPEKTINQPVIILENGEIVELNNDNALKKNNINVKGNKVIADAQRISMQKVEPALYTAVMPSRFKYTFVLDDGTEVTLNANSELKYPDKFVGDRRVVYLKGEAFFKVKKDSRPFIVNSFNVDIRVYGTEFNVNSYDKKNIETVLVKGSVSVAVDGDKNSEQFIKPNQLAKVVNGEKCSVSNVDVKNYLSWIDGYLRCNGEPLSKMFTKLSKWYGVKFIYDTESIQQALNSNIEVSFDMTRPLQEALKSLEILLDINIIKMEEGKYMIK